MNWQLLFELSDAPGLPGYEAPIAAIMEREFSKLTTDISRDSIGNIIAHISGEGPRVELDAHMDEVGFIVSHIEDAGFLRVIPLGGIDPRVFAAQRVVVHGKKRLFGVVGAVPPHLTRGAEAERDKTVPVEESFIDLGISPEEARANVRIGDLVTFATTCCDLGDAIIGKAFDDRAGLFIMLEAARAAKKIACDLYLVAATQEERGLRGARCAAHTISPDIAIAIEGTLTNDLPGVPPQKRLACQGLGPEIRITDREMISDRGLVDYLDKIALDRGIPHQFVVKSVGATNAAAIQVSRGGVRTTAISVPVRYIHSPQGLVRKCDIENAIALVAAFLENADGLLPKA